MGLSRRIKFKYKFVQKYKTNVYQLFTKKNFVRDLFVFKFFSRLFRFEAYALERKLAKITVVERAKKHRTRQNVAIVCFRVQIKYFLVLWQLLLIFGLSQKNLLKLVRNFCVFLNRKGFVFNIFLLQRLLFTTTRVLSFFYLFRIVRSFLNFFKRDFVHTKNFLRNLTRFLKKKDGFSSESRFSNRNRYGQQVRFGFFANAVSKKRSSFRNKSKKKNLYLRKLKKYLHRFNFFKNLYVTFFDKTATKKRAKLFDKNFDVFSIVKFKLAGFKTPKLNTKFWQKNVHFNKVKNPTGFNSNNRNFRLYNNKYNKSKYKQSGKFNKYTAKKSRHGFLSKVYPFEQQKPLVKIKKKLYNNSCLKSKKQNIWKNFVFFKDKQGFRKRFLFRVFLGYSVLKVAKSLKFFKQKLNKRFFALKKFYTKTFPRFSMSNFFFPNMVLVKRNQKLKLTFTIWQRLLPFFFDKTKKASFF